MSVRVLPAVVASLVAVALAVLLFVPFVAREHRRRGELRPGTLLLFLAALLYALGLVAYVLVPLPPVAPGFCEVFGELEPQWRPLAGFDGLRRPQHWMELTGLLADGSVQQFGFNVLLFVPLGMFGRYLGRLSLPWTVLAGFAASLLVEVTQITGIWFLYPCPYRLFDVDDLLANTAGALAGAVAAPLLRLLPGQRSTADAGTPRPVTARRRLLGMSCDVLALVWLGLIIGRGTQLALGATGAQVPPGLGELVESAALWLLPALVLLLVPLAGGGTTLGQRTVLLRTVAGDRSPGARAVLVRWLSGLGGLALLEALANLVWPQAGAALAVLWCAAHAFGVLRTRNHRGISGRAAGTAVADARPGDPADRTGSAAQHR